MMSKDKKERIIELRYKGKSYGDIAETLRTSKESVRSVCRRKNLTDNDLESISVCLNCGIPISQPKRGSRKAFCSERCRTAWRRANNRISETIYHRTCQECGSEFNTVGNKTQRYCSRNCYFKHRRDAS